MTARTAPDVADRLLTALAPASWGTTYVVTATMLPPDRPLLAALLRALPAGLLVLVLIRRMPPAPVWWWRFLVLGVLNFGGFFPLLFYAAYRLPGGVAATLATVQPLIVAGLAWLVLRTRTPAPRLVAAVAGAGGVALLTLTAKARLDAAGLGAMLAAVAMLSLGIVLGKRWGSPGTPLLSTGWQMSLGGLVLVPLTLGVEGLPDRLTPANLAGYGYLATIGGALSYLLWFRGIERLSPTSVSLLSLASPITATLAGLLVLGQTLTVPQLVGLGVALAALVLGQRRHTRAAPIRRRAPWRPDPSAPRVPATAAPVPADTPARAPSDTSGRAPSDTSGRAASDTSGRAASDTSGRAASDTSRRSTARSYPSVPRAAWGPYRCVPRAASLPCAPARQAACR
jgi:probable blue pigment (indigoidine) exporter